MAAAAAKRRREAEATAAPPVEPAVAAQGEGGTAEGGTAAEGGKAARVAGAEPEWRRDVVPSSAEEFRARHGCFTRGEVLRPQHSLPPAGEAGGGAAGAAGAAEAHGQEAWAEYYRQQAAWAAYHQHQAAWATYYQQQGKPP